MSSIEACLTWAIAIRPDLLGAHLEAYINLLPTITTLHLCHRFGKGEKVAISKLPTEIVLSIEAYLMEGNRVKYRRVWAAKAKCWEARCKPLDHFPKKDWKGMYQSHCLKMKRDLEEEGLDDPLTKRQIAYFNKALAEWPGSWRFEHRKNIQTWQAKIGEPAGEDRGIFSKYSELIINHFGLNVWIAYTQLDKRLQGQRGREGVYTSVKCYLTLPEYGKVTRKLLRTWDDGDYDGDSLTVAASDDMPTYLPTETGLGFAVETPGQLSEVTVKRFRRAMNILGLKRCGEPKGQKDLYVKQNGRETDAAAEKTKRAGPNHSDDIAKPELTFLIKNIDSPEDS